MSTRIGNTVVAGNGDLSTKANIASPTFTGTVTAPTFSGALSGNASVATKAKNIPITDEGGNIWIDGTIIDTTYTTGINTASTASQCTGNSATATKLATARLISLIGAVTGSANFDGSGNVNISTTYSDVESHSFSSNGYIKFKNGFILQWGKTTATGTVTFPIAFPTNCAFIVMQPMGGLDKVHAEWWYMVDAVTTTSFSNQNFTGYWLAIGY